MPVFDRRRSRLPTRYSRWNRHSPNLVSTSTSISSPSAGGEFPDAEAKSADHSTLGPFMSELPRNRYCALYGPTGDRIVSPTPTYSSKSKPITASAVTRLFGGGKVINESMGQSTNTAEGTLTS